MRGDERLRLFQQGHEAAEQGLDLERVEHGVGDLKRRGAGGHQVGVVFDELFDLLAAQTGVARRASGGP